MSPRDCRSAIVRRLKRGCWPPARGPSDRPEWRGLSIWSAAASHGKSKRVDRPATARVLRRTGPLLRAASNRPNLHTCKARLADSGRKHTIGHGDSRTAEEGSNKALISNPPRDTRTCTRVHTDSLSLSHTSHTRAHMYASACTHECECSQTALRASCSMQQPARDTQALEQAQTAHGAVCRRLCLTIDL